MPDPQIVSCTLRQLLDDPEVLAAFEDPGGYLADAGPRWIDFLRDNPRGRPEDLVIVLTVAGRRVVGALRSIPVDLLIGGKTVHVGALRGFALDPDWRAGGAGGMMLLRVLSAARAAMASGGPRPETMALYARTGFTALGPLARYVYFASTRPLIDVAFRGAPYVSAASSAVDPLARLYYRLRRPAVRANLAFLAVERFSSSLDELLASRGGDHMIRGSRDLNWVLAYSPALRAYEIRDGRVLVGYSVLRVENRPPTTVPMWLPAMRAASLLDFYLGEPSAGALLQLMAHAVERAGAAAADILEIQTNNPVLASSLRRAGFVHLGGNKVYLRAPAGVRVDPSRWNMTEAQGDVLCSALDVRAT